MEQPIKDKFMKLQIWHNYGNYQLFILLKIIYLEWELQYKEHQPILIFTLEVTQFQEYKLMEIISFKLEKH